MHSPYGSICLLALDISQKQLHVHVRCRVQVANVVLAIFNRIALLFG